MSASNVAATIISRWSKEFQQLYGGSLPDSYLCFDLETSGFSRKNDLILEWGHTVVRDRKVIDRLSFYINWYAVNRVPAAWLDNQLLRIRGTMAAEGKPWHITPEILKTRGVHPDKAIAWIYDFMTTADAQRMFLITQNGWNFDFQMLESHFFQDLGKPFQFHANRVFDVGCIAKAGQAIDNPKMLPVAGETMQAYFKRVNYVRAPGIKWNLGRCVELYELDKRYGIDLKDLHGAGPDSYVLHLLFETFREAVDTQTQKPAFESRRPRTAPPPAIRETHAMPDRGDDAESDRMHQELKTFIDDAFPEPVTTPPARPTNYRKQKVR